MTTTHIEPEAMDEYFADCASIPDRLRPAPELASLPAPRFHWAPVAVPDSAAGLVDGLAPYGS